LGGGRLLSLRVGDDERHSSEKGSVSELGPSAMLCRDPYGEGLL
jgi:hypothetical protein